MKEGRKEGRKKERKKERKKGRKEGRNKNMTFREPLNVIYSYNKSQEGALLLNFILVKN